MIRKNKNNIIQKWSKINFNISFELFFADEKHNFLTDSPHFLSCRFQITYSILIFDFLTPPFLHPCLTLSYFGNETSLFNKKKC